MINMHRKLWSLTAKIFFVTIGLLFLSSNALAKNSVKLYGHNILFDVYREGNRVGEHSVRFEQNASELDVVTSFELAIDILFFRAYTFSYQSRSQWREGELASISVQVDDNGEDFRFDAVRKGEVMQVKNPDGDSILPAPIFPTNHWNAAVLQEHQILNTLTGKLNQVKIVEHGKESVSTEAGKIVATRYAYTGDLDTEVWYDTQGRWVKMRFTGKDGSMIEYRCRRCQNGLIEKTKR